MLPLMGCAALCFAAACRREAPAPAGGTSAPRRVVCGSPAVTEIVFALGCGARVVGVSDYVVYPAEAMDKPRVGGWLNPSRERLLMLRPDLIVTQGRHESLAGFAAKHGIRLLGVAPDTLEGIRGSIVTIAETLQVKDAGERLAASAASRLAALRSRLAGAPARRTALFVAHTPGELARLTTTGAGTYLDELVTLAGGTNVFGDVTSAYPRVSKEAILARAPEVIVELSPGASESRRARLAEDWAMLPEAPGAAPRRVVVLTEAFLLIPGPRLVLTAERLARAVHPERFHE